MTPKEKAIELVNKFPLNGLILKNGDSPKQYKEHAKQCALISVFEMFNEIDDNYDTLHSSDRKQYWLQVSKEIINL